MTILLLFLGGGRQAAASSTWALLRRSPELELDRDSAPGPDGGSGAALSSGVDDMVWSRDR